MSRTRRVIVVTTRLLPFGQFFNFSLEGQDLFVPGVFLSPLLLLTEGIIDGFCLDHEVLVVDVLVLVCGDSLHVSDCMEEFIISTGLVHSEQSRGDAIAHDLSAITGDGKDLGVDVIMKLLDVELEFF